MQVGKKVVCIDDYFAPEIAALYNELPKQDAIYVIRAIHEGVNRDDGHPQKVTALLLVGIVNPSPALPGAKERGFNSVRFRELDEMKQQAKQVKVEELDCVGVNDVDVRIYEH